MKNWNVGMSWLDYMVDIHRTFWFYIILVCISSSISFVGSIWLLYSGKLETGIVLAVAAIGFMAYFLNAHFQRRTQIEKMTKEILIAFRERRSTLSEDPDLLSIFTGETPELSATHKLKLELYLYSLFDVYLYAFYLLRCGYLDNKKLVYKIFRNMLAKTMAMPHVIEIWEQEVNGSKLFQNEYPTYLVEIIDDVVQDIIGDI